MSNPGFALNLDMSRYFDDLRKYCSVFVNFSKCKNVGDVENHIKYIFKLEENICLTNKKFLIPRSEDIHILQQHDTLRVQKCDFFDYQIHEETKKRNKPCDQTALNLIQTDRSIDLSCRPKQRVNTCHNNSISGTLSTPLMQNCEEYFQSLSTVQCCNSPDKEHTIQTKEKSSKKKRKSKVMDDFDGDTNVLDMSIQTSERKNGEDYFASNIFTETYPKSTNDQSINSNDIDDISFGLESSFCKLQKKNMKRKKLANSIQEYQSINLDNSCYGMEDERQSAEVEKPNLNQFCEDSNKCLNSDLRFSKSTSEGMFREGFTSIDLHKSTVSHEISKKALKKSVMLLKHQENEHSCTNQTFSEKKPDDYKICYSEFNHETSDVCLDYSRDKTKLNEYTPKVHKMNCERLNFSNCSMSDEEQINNLLPYEIENKQQQSNYSLCKNYGNDSLTKANTKKSFPQMTEKGFRRKRVRKHNKKKKREKIKYTTAVGPVLNMLAVYADSKPSPAPSDIAKHIYFTEDDFAEEMKIPSTPTNCLQPTSEGSLKNTNKKDQDSESLETPTVPSTNDMLLKTHVTWQEQLLKLAKCSSKPVVFCRNGLKKVDDNESDLICDSSTGLLKSASKTVLVEVSSDIKSLNCINSKQNVENNTEKSITVDVADTKVDDLRETLKNVISTNYPIIDKVVSEDLILFKVLKLEDKQPGCSKTILAKVIDSSHFPEKIILQIIEGFEECDPFKITTENGERCITDFRWSDILEPRLFYP